MSAIEWGDPPPTRHGRLTSFIEELKTQPGKWAKYPVPVSRQMGIQNGMKNPGTEWTTRSRPHRKVDLYGRWVGNGDQS